MYETGYFVWNPSEREPRYRHESYSSAVQEAERLASVHVGEKFVVLRAIGFARVDRPAIYKSTVNGHGNTSDPDVPF